MDDEELVDLNNFCADLVSLKRWEAFPVRLLTATRKAEWVRVQELCHETGLSAENLKPDLFVSWLADPTGEEEYAVILFFDEESMWTMAARYNRQRLVDRAARVAVGETGEVS